MADQPLGTAVAVRQDAAVLLAGADTTTLLRGSDLFEGQTITTGPKGEVQVIFGDDTHLVVGPDSSLVIEKYLLRNDGTVQKFAVNALAGTFRFLTGNSEKGAYQIITPTGTLGVRGTKFDFTVDRLTGKTDVVLFEGQVFLCAKNTDCVTISERCGMGSVVNARDALLIDPRHQRSEIANSDFRYVDSQQSLKADFRVRKSSECGSAAPKAPEIVASAVPEVVIVPPPPPPPPPPPDDDHDDHHHDHHDNNGHGNGGDNDDEGDNEHGNPGKGKGKGKGH